MGKKGKRRLAGYRPKPNYELVEVRELISKGRWLVTNSALETARRDFAWGVDEIRDALMRLEPRHFYKPDVSQHDRWLALDFHKARGLKQEDVYTHFYIDDADNGLVVNSFKRI